MKIFSFVFIFFSFLAKACLATEVPMSGNKPISHELWDNLLKKHVDNQGFVDYGGFKKDISILKSYLNLIQNNAPNEQWTKDEQLAFWINAYNAFTIQLILDYSSHSLKSIKDIGDKIKIPLINSPWDIKFITISGKKIDLNTIEHGIIRKNFDEPRIHFALVCAAKSCPKLRNEAFVPNKLSRQLEEQAIDFINDSNKNKINGNELKLSSIFNWYAGDFEAKMPIYQWINKYAKAKTNHPKKISYLDYNWELNGKF